MVQTNVKELLKKLVALQKFDVELYEYRRGLKEKPEELALLKAKYDAKMDRYHQLQDQAKETELARKAKELDLKAKEENIVKANAALMTLKTNKEYQAKLFEIENMKADKSLLEEEILKTMDASDKIQQEIAQEKDFLAEEEKKYLAEKEKVDAIIDQLTQKASAIEADRRLAAEGVDKNILAVYERVVDNREGIAMVPVTGAACGGCFMHVPEQVINKIKMYDELVRCEMCARFLYLADEIG